jgi:hypothetical protein
MVKFYGTPVQPFPSAVPPKLVMKQVVDDRPLPA